MSAEKRAILRRVPVFNGLSDDECDAVLEVIRARRGKAGDVLFREGDPGGSLMIVFEGELIAHVNMKGVDKEMARMKPGEVFGELAFIDGEPRSATVTTPTGATILDFTHEGMALLRERSPRVAAAIYRNILFDLSRRVRALGDKVSDGTTPKRHKSVDHETARKYASQLTPEQLREQPALENFATEDLALLSHISTLRSFTLNQALMEEGDTADCCMILLTGRVMTTRARQGTLLSSLGPGAVLGQLALTDGGPRSATVMAIAACTALEIKKDAFEKLLNAHSAMALRFQEVLVRAGAEQLRIATRRFTKLAARGVHS